MKKLIVAAVGIAMAIVTNAAQIKWTCADGIANATEEDWTSATMVYLVNAADITASDIYTAVQGGATLDSVVAAKAVASFDDATSISSTFNYGYTADTKQNLYMVCFDSDMNALYFSEQIEKTILGTGATKYGFTANSSMEAAMADMSTFDASVGGWVSTAAVPEPTSGLLLLLGMAGLALKRKQA